MGPGQKFILLIQYQNRYYTLEISYIFVLCAFLHLQVSVQIAKGKEKCIVRNITIILRISLESLRLSIFFSCNRKKLRN